MTKKLTNSLVVGGVTNNSPLMIWQEAEHRHCCPWCGGDTLALGLGIIGPHAMVWAVAANLHGQQKM